MERQGTEDTHSAEGTSHCGIKWWPCAALFGLQPCSLADKIIKFHVCVILKKFYIQPPVNVFNAVSLLTQYHCTVRYCTVYILQVRNISVIYVMAILR